MKMRSLPFLFAVAWSLVAACDSATVDSQEEPTPAPDATAPMPDPPPLGSTTPDPKPPAPDAGKAATGQTEPAKCSKPASQKGFVGTKEIAFGTQKRKYELYVGENYDGTTKLPVLFVFHGDGQDGNLIRSWTHLEYGSGGNGIVVYPSEPYGTWDTDTPAATNADYAFVDEILADLDRQLCIDSKRVFGWGLSRGAYFANSIGCYRGDKFRGIFATGGGGPNSTNPEDHDPKNYFFTACTSPPTSAMIIHAFDDQTVAYATGVNSRDHWLIANGCTDETVGMGPSPCVAYTNCTSGNIVQWCSIGGGHAFWGASPDATWNMINALK